MVNKVLQLCLSDGKGGMELYVDRTIEGLKENGWEVIGICLNKSKVEGYMQRNNIAYTAFKSNIFALFNVLSIRRWLIKENINIIHCHKSSDLRLTTLLALLMPGLEIFYTDHVGGKRPKKSLYHRLAYGKVSRVISISQATYQRNVINFPVPRQQVICLPHGVDINKYQPCNNENIIRAKREALGIPEGATLIGLPGRVTPGKGHDIWVKALIELDPKLNFYALSIGGTDYSSGGVESFYKSLQALIADTPLANKIAFLGHHSDLADILPILDIVCIPSKNEAFGLTIIESMACGLPIVGSNTGSLPELVDPDSGVLVGPLDVSGWRDAIDALIRNKAQRHTMGNAARQRVEQQFSHQQHVKRLIDIYSASASFY